jgi:hypothetical protein
MIFIAGCWRIYRKKDVAKCELLLNFRVTARSFNLLIIASMNLQWRDVFSYRTYLLLLTSSRSVEPTRMFPWVALAMLTIALSSCNVPKDGADAQTRPAGRPRGLQTAAVDVAIAATTPLQPNREYTGTTQPVREVAIRAQAEGQVQSLNVDVGDRVRKGQVLARIDDSLLSAATAEAAAELGSRQAEIGQLPIRFG